MGHPVEDNLFIGATPDICKPGGQYTIHIWPDPSKPPIKARVHIVRPVTYDEYRTFQRALGFPEEAVRYYPDLYYYAFLID